MSRGFSLIEAVVSIAILLVGVLAVVSLGLNVVVQSRQTSAKVVATQLAREAVEVVRGQRDSNWLETENNMAIDWDFNLHSETDYTLIPVWDTPYNIWSMEFAAVAIGDCGGTYDCTRVYVSTGSPYEFRQFSPSLPASSLFSETQFQRLVQTFPICRSQTDETSENTLTTEGVTCSATEDTVGVHVIATVVWSEQGINYTSSVEENLYDWKY